VTIGITGATGFLGAALLSFLHEHSPGHVRIVPFSARLRGNPLTDHLRPRYQRLDITSRDEVMEKTRGIDILYHVAGAVDYSRRGRVRTWDVNVLGTKNILDAAAANGLRRLVYVSSISVLGVPPAPHLTGDETNDRYSPGRNPISFPGPESALQAVDASLRGDYGFAARMKVPYFDSKLAAFELTMRHAIHMGQNIVVVLPGTAVGAGDVGFSIGGLVQRVYDSQLKVTLPGSTSFVSAPDVARGMALAAEKGRTGEAYILTGAERDNLRYRDFMHMVARVARESFGRRCFDHFLVVPAPVAGFVARIAESLSSRALLHEGLAIAGGLAHRFGCRKAARELGYVPEVPLEQSIRACIEFNLRTMGKKA
jgi:dihydroflavonol-4-reductase